MTFPEPAAPGVWFLEHTADVGLEARAESPQELFERAASGMTRLLVEELPAPTEERTLAVEATDLPMLLRDWLRALLRWHEEGFTASDATVHALAPDRQGRWSLSAGVRGGAPVGDPIREIKGVTLHGLAAERRPEGWYARVIFDV